MDIPFVPSEITAACTSQHWWAVTLLEGRLRAVQHGTTIRPESSHEQWAYRMADLLQRELHHDGRWVVAWTDPKAVVNEDAIVNPGQPQRWAMIFMDRDGDVQFQVSVRDPLWECVMTGPLVFAKQAHEAWLVTEERKHLADIRPGIDTFKRALGERPALAH